MTLLAALQDTYAEIAQGGPATTVIEDVAADYGLNPDLLSRKFSESYGNPETLKDRLDAAASAEAAFQTRAAAERAARAAAAEREGRALADYLLNHPTGRATLAQILRR